MFQLGDFTFNSAHLFVCLFVCCSLTQGPGQLTAVLEERLHALASSLPRLMRQHGQFGCYHGNSVTTPTRLSCMIIIELFFT